MNNQMLAYMLMNQRPPSPMQSFASSFAAGLNANPWDLNAANGKNVWEQLGRFFSGQNSRRDKTPIDDAPAKFAERGVDPWANGRDGGWYP